MSDRLVTRSMYREAYGISDETVRRDLKAGRLPPFDEAPTRKRQAWYASTLVRAGKLLFADPTNQPTPAASSRVQPSICHLVASNLP